MIDVYGMSSPNVFKITIMLEECELPYRTHHVNVFAGQQFEPEFLRISPNNKVPVLTDDAGPNDRPFTVIESGAILLYLAAKSGRLLPVAPGARSVVEQWLMVQIASISLSRPGKPRLTRLYGGRDSSTASLNPLLS